MAEREEFFKYLDWLYCWFCEEKCSAKVTFYYLQCGGICCVSCINKRRQPKPENKIRCCHCKKLVGSMRIDLDMPKKFRSAFENPEKYLNKYLEDEKIQSQIRQNFINYMDAKIENVTKYGNKLRQDGNALKKSVDEIANKRDHLITRVGSVISVERIKQMVETMTLEEINQMPYEQMVSGQPRQRRRDNVHYQSELSHSISTSSRSQSRSSHNRTGPLSPSLHDDFNNLRLATHFPRQPIDNDQRRRSHAFGYYDGAESPRPIHQHQHQRQPPDAVDTPRQSRDHYKNLDSFAVAAASPRRRSLNQSNAAAEPRRRSLNQSNAAASPRRRSLNQSNAAAEPRRRSLNQSNAAAEPRRRSLNQTRAAAEPRRRESQHVRNARNVPNVSDPNARMAFYR